MTRAHAGSTESWWRRPTDLGPTHAGPPPTLPHRLGYSRRLPSFDFASHILVLTTGETFTTNELVDVVQTALLDDRFRPGMDLLFDNRGSKERASSDDLRERAQLFAELRHHLSGRCAVVVDDQIHFDLAKMAANYGKLHGLEISVFWDLDEAIECLPRAS